MTNKCNCYCEPKECTCECDNKEPDYVDIDYRISVMRAFKDGKKIEFSLWTWDTWYPVGGPCWDWSKWLYRVKPEPVKPKELWVNFYDGPIPELAYATHLSEKDAIKNATKNAIRVAVKFVEVI